MENTDIKGVIFDYGGTIDCCGDHWAVILRQAYESIDGLGGLPLETFIEAYVYAERAMARYPYVRPEHTFLDTLRIKARLELEYLFEHGHIQASDISDYAEAIARYCNSHAISCIEEARPTLEYLAARYPLVLVSNFYGNIATVLRTFGLDHFFPTIIESAVVGVRKPDPAIFALGVEALSEVVPGIEAKDVLVVGDSLSKDILPAESLGCRTAWIKGRPWFKDKEAPQRPDIIRKLSELQSIY